MKASNFRDALASLSDVLRQAGARQAAEDVELVEDCLDNDGHLTAAESIQRLEDRLDEQKRPPLSPDQYVRELRAAGSDPDQFDSVFAKLSQDKSLRAADLKAIAKEYAGQGISVRSKNDALDQLQRRFSRLLYDNNAARQADSTPW